MGRPPTFPPLPSKEPQSVALVPMPKLTPETLAERKREISLLTRGKLDAKFDEVVDAIFELENTITTYNSRGDASLSIDPLKLKLETLKWLADRGYGKAPQVVKVDTDTDTPNAILAEIARKRTEATIAQMEADRMRADAVTTEIEKETES